MLATPGHALLVGTCCLLRPIVMSAAGSAGVGVPSIEVLAARQRAAIILQENWPTVAERLGGILSGDSVQVGPSPVHSLGVFAQRDIEEGELVALHPVDRVLQQLGGGQVAGALADEVDGEYFRPADPSSISSEELAYRQVAYRQTYAHVNPQRPETFLIDANPLKDDVVGWLGHRINDGATLSPGATDEQVAEYYRASGEARNTVAVALCVPLLAFVATEKIASGDELLCTYGHAYWTQSVEPVGEAADEAFGLTRREADLWQVATDKKFSIHEQALDDFIAKTAAPEPPTPAQASPRSSTPPPRPTSGFGGAAAAKPKLKKKGKKR